ncbi:MAG: hypothetical protein QOI10_1472 [Solirubrobacterales bacterium]|jgi:hypothetical protein|nr:hypothetical protein [Solirubrobacterales bacterium]
MPEVGPGAARLRVEGYFLGHAALILTEELPAKLADVSKFAGELQVTVIAGEALQVGGAVSLDWGSIEIVADRLTERFDPAELRRTLQKAVDEARLEGDRRAEQDESRAREFLSDLAADPPPE